MMTRRQFLTVAAGAGAVAVVGGGAFLLLPGSEELTGDPKVKYGEDSCVHCTMVISDDRFAAAWREGTKRERYFDDVGCMVAYTKSRRPPEGTVFFVRDFAADLWIDAESAFYMVAPGIKSPMSYDIAAFASQEAATTNERTRDGQPQTWAGLLDTLEDRG